MSDLIPVKNHSSQGRRITWGGSDYVFEGGETKLLPRDLADAFQHAHSHEGIHIVHSKAPASAEPLEPAVKAEPEPAPEPTVEPEKSKATPAPEPPARATKRKK